MLSTYWLSPPPSGGGGYAFGVQSALYYFREDTVNRPFEEGTPTPSGEEDDMRRLRSREIEQSEEFCRRGQQPPGLLRSSHPHSAKVVWQAALLLGLSVSAVAQSGTYSNISGYGVPTANSFPGGITAGPDGALWFTENQGNKIGRITTAGVITEYPVLTVSSHPFAITTGPDGALWFAEGGSGSISGKIGRITTTGIVTEYPVPTVQSNPLGITAGPDGALWFTEMSGNNIGRISTAGAVTEYPVFGSPWGITAGPDGALWFTEYQNNQIGRITTAGVIAAYTVVPGSPIQTYPLWITAGPDGALWFTLTGQVGRITTAGVVTGLYPVGRGPSGITPGPDGALWFALSNRNGIGRITTGGIITRYSVPAAEKTPNMITRGSDGALWFTASYGNYIGRAPACALGLGVSFSGTTLTTSFNLGIDTPATWNIFAQSTALLTKLIPAVVPPRAFTMNWEPFPGGGDVLVKSTLSTPRDKSSAPNGRP